MQAFLCETRVRWSGALGDQTWVEKLHDQNTKES